MDPGTRHPGTHPAVSREAREEWVRVDPATVVPLAPLHALQRCSAVYVVRVGRAQPTCIPAPCLHLISQAAVLQSLYTSLTVTQPSSSQPVQKCRRADALCLCGL